ncbi:hypothetical protein Cni_G19176 [Canna indica]|uniref:Uncharacterized protein n=1 Tax=Canna indica TaxID=4628 RepID=A0AAQ3KQZ6_9LILI|nr:hypothetical protein Cni_G19176 [Canna indica]
MVGPVVAAWILEFLLRNPDVSDALVGELTLVLPLPSPLPPRLSSALLLRRLAADLSRRSVSSRTLHSLERLHRLRHSPSLLPAFAAVAVECTVAPLRHRPLSSSFTDADVEFFDAVNKIWNCQVAELERSEAAGLMSQALREARREMEAAVMDSALREELVRRETKEAALEAVRVCLEEVRKEMGPTFLEAAAEVVVGWDREELVGSKTDGPLIALGDKMRTLLSSRFDSVERGVEMHHIPSKMDKSRSKLLSELVQSSKRVNLSGGNVEEDRLGALNQNLSINSTIVKPKKEAFDGKISNNELQSGQLDPIQSDPKEVDQKHKSILAYESSCPDEKHLRCNSLDANITTNLDSTTMKKPSLVDRNATAHTYEWDSFSTESGQSPETRKETDYLSFKKSKISSALADPEEFVLQRRKRKWNILEEETLRKAVAQYGAGNWKLIKRCHPEIFKRRSEVDLKDKWRNMSRYL